jgi:acyl dehydratase
MNPYIENKMLTFEDFNPGRFGTFGPHHVSREDIIAFASEYDPQPMHLDEEAARHSLLKGLSGSGWHMCALLIRISWDGFMNHSAAMGSPGVDEVRWIAPLRPGDDLTLDIDVLDKRVSKSRPDMGLVHLKNTMRNAAGEILMIATLTFMIGLRAYAAVE